MASVLAVACVGVVLAVPAPAMAAEGDVTIQGRGFGHGRGMGQYGSLGYAVDHGWSSAQILDHYYGGTRAGNVGDAGISVELLSWRDRSLLVSGGGLSVNGRPVEGGAVQVVRSGPTEFRVLTAPGCGGPWTDRVLAGADVTVAAASGVELCELGVSRGYAGDVRMVLRSGGTAIINQLPVESYLRGVVPRESPASWASAGAGRGAQALQAQSVAARSYALSSRFAPYATTCDTTTCQVYGGSHLRSHATGAVTSLTDPRTDAAIAATAGLVRLSANGAVVRTEFSSSTGGWSAGGAFPGVQDLGDATAANPNRAWTVTMSRADISARLGVGQVTGLTVSRRNGAGADGGRVLDVVATTPGGPVSLSGATVRTRLGLKSDWFTLTTFTDPALSEPVVKALWQDVLGRPPAPAELAGRSNALAAGATSYALASELSRSSERAQRVVVSTYQETLGRTPSTGEIQGWMGQFQASGSIPTMQAGILASQEAWLVSGGQPEAWVDRMYRVTLGRPAGARERADWGARIASESRYSVAMGIGASREAANRRLAGYYVTLLGRDPDPSSVGWVPYLLGGGDGDLVLPAVVGGSLEYAVRADARF